MHMKHLKHLKHMLATSEEGREREVQLEKPAPSLATPDLVMSRAEVEHRSGADVNSGHDLLVGNNGVDNTLTRRGMGHCTQGQEPDTTRRGGVGAAGDEVRHGGRCGVAQRGMEAPP
jgi:hypothetical protein